MTPSSPRLTRSMRSMVRIRGRERGTSMEQVYKTMRAAGVINIVIGSVLITVGLAAGVLAIVSGSFLLKRKAKITF